MHERAPQRSASRAEATRAAQSVAGVRGHGAQAGQATGLRALADRSPQAAQLRALQAMADGYAAGQALNASVVQASGRGQPMPMFNNSMKDIEAELDADSDHDDDVEDPRAEFVERVGDFDFNDVTTEDFRTNHAVGSGGNFQEKAKRVAERRAKPESTSIQFGDAAKGTLVAEIVAATLGFKLGEEPASLQNRTTKDSYTYATYAKADENYNLSGSGTGKIKYAAEGVKVLGGREYQVNHLDGITAD